MKYESTILKRLIDTYGVVGNPRYISEIIKEFIIQGKECYPDLFTYQSDWLAHIDEFGLNPSYTVSYTGQSIYAPNTLEKPVKSAILTGNTLVNLTKNFKYQTGWMKNWGGESKNTQRCCYQVENAKDGTKYLIKTFGESTQAFIRYYDNSDENPLVESRWLNLPTIITTPSNTKKFAVSIRISTNNEDYTSVEQANKNLVIEYQNGMENWDIPYFEGMQSVKIPVLTTTGKNFVRASEDLFVYRSGFTKPSVVFENGGFSFTSAFNASICGFRLPIKLQKDKTYYVKCDYENMTTIRIYGSDILSNEIDTNWETKVLNQNGERFTFDKQFEYYYVGFYPNAGFQMKIKNLQIEEGTVATSYEPYKSNILTTPEDLELRGIGNVQDTLDCLTGEVTQRIGEIVADGVNFKFVKVSQNANQYGDGSVRFDLQELNDINTKVSNNWGDASKFIINDRLKTGFFPTFANTKEKDVISMWDKTLVIVFSDTNIRTVKQANDWLKQNPITIQYQLSEESIKTVDLTILDQNGQNVKQLMSFNGGTHFNTGSSVGSPLPTVSVSVETDLEETLKRCSLEGNTL